MPSAFRIALGIGLMLDSIENAIDRLLHEEPVIMAGRDWSRLALTGKVVLALLAFVAALLVIIASCMGAGWLLLEPTSLADNVCRERDNGQGNGTLVPRACELPDYGISGFVGFLAAGGSFAGIRALWPRKVAFALEEGAEPGASR